VNHHLADFLARRGRVKTKQTETSSRSLFIAHRIARIFHARSSPPYAMTPSMPWITPFDAMRSGFTTTFPLIVTPPSSFRVRQLELKGVEGED
jgi:hypothetical protein